MAHLPRFWKGVYGIDGPPTAAQLISFLTDDGESIDVRDDAALDLGGHDEVEAEMTLLWFASSAVTPRDIHDVAGESLAQIWTRRGGFTREKFLSLSPGARQEVRAASKREGMLWDVDGG